MNSSTIAFFSDLSRRISTVSGDIRESSYLFQRIAIIIQQTHTTLFTNQVVQHREKNDT